MDRYTTRWFVSFGFPQARLQKLPQAHRRKRFAASLPGELFGLPQTLQPIHRGGVGSGLRQIAQFGAHRTSLSKREGSRFECFLVAKQVSSYGSIIETAEDGAQPISAGTHSSCLVGLLDIIEANDTSGNQELRKQPPRIGLVRRPGVLTPDHHHEDCVILPSNPIPHLALYVRMNTQRMHFAAQRARLPFEPEMTSCYEIE